VKKRERKSIRSGLKLTVASRVGRQGVHTKLIPPEGFVLSVGAALSVRARI
jgi:hypothetical protein